METNPETGARYSQPLPAYPRDVGGPIVYAGFCDGEAGFIFRGEDGEVKRVAATKENSAVEKPRGFFHSLARLMYGSNR